MADVGSPIPELEGDEQLVAAAKYISNTIISNENLSEESKTVLANLFSQLSSFVLFSQKIEDIGVLVSLLHAIQKKVMSSEADEFTESVAGHSQCLSVADEARMLVEKFNCLPTNREDNDDLIMELQTRASFVLQKAMTRLLNEFVHILCKSKKAGDLPSPWLHEDNRSCPNDLSEPSVHRDSPCRVPGFLKFFDDDAVSNLKSIATLMFNSKFDQQCGQAYIIERKKAFEEYLNGPEIDNIKKVWIKSKMSLNTKINKWALALQTFLQVYLPSEFRLCEQIFSELGTMTENCFVKASEASMLRFLEFGENIFFHHDQEEIFLSILDTYKELLSLFTCVGQYMGEAGSYITKKYHELLRRFGDFVCAYLTEFRKIIASDDTTIPILGGGIHPLSQRVVNLLVRLPDHVETLNLFFADREDEGDLATFSPEVENRELYPVACRFLLVADILERMLEAKSQVYQDASLHHLFMMNNIHYVHNKVESCGLRLVFGENWITVQRQKVDKHLLDCIRTSWIPILSLLNVEDSGNPSSSSSSINPIKKRLKSFISAFKQIYKTQTGWVVPDEELRSNLYASLSNTLIPVYRNFEKSYTSQRAWLSEYQLVDLENYLMDLFMGSPKSF